MTPSIRWPEQALREAISPLLPGFTVEMMPRIDSTNTELMRRARSGPCPPTLLIAEEQTAGRGRLGRTWHSTPGASLTFSLGMPLCPHDWSGLSLAVGVSVAESLQPLPPTGSSIAPRLATAHICLKWPNDLWLNGDRKLGGILVETSSFVATHTSDASATACADTARYVVVGIGLNVLPPAHTQDMSLPPGSLQDLEPGLEAPAALLRIAPPLVAMLQSFEGYGFAPMQARFAARDALHGRAVTLSNGQTGTAHGVSEDGALLVHTAGGMQAITSSEISVRPIAMRPI